MSPEERGQWKEKKRIVAILSHPLAAENFRAAVTLACCTDLPTRKVIRILRDMVAFQHLAACHENSWPAEADRDEAITITTIH